MDFKSHMTGYGEIVGESDVEVFLSKETPPALQAERIAQIDGQARKFKGSRYVGMSSDDFDEGTVRVVLKYKL